MEVGTSKKCASFQLSRNNQPVAIYIVAEKIKILWNIYYRLRVELHTKVATKSLMTLAYFECTKKVPTIFYSAFDECCNYLCIFRHES